jgi:hypothetical protein
MGSRATTRPATAQQTRTRSADAQTVVQHGDDREAGGEVGREDPEEAAQRWPHGAEQKDDRRNAEATSRLLTGEIDEPARPGSTRSSRGTGPIRE